MITMNDPQCNPQTRAQMMEPCPELPDLPYLAFYLPKHCLCRLFLTTNAKPFVKKDFLLNKFNETSSCSEIRPWSKLASTLKNKAGQIVCQILSSNMKEQKPKKHSLSSSLLLSSHVSTSFYLFPLPFILDMMCQMIYSVSNIDI